MEGILEVYIELNFLYKVVINIRLYLEDIIIFEIVLYGFKTLTFFLKV